MILAINKNGQPAPISLQNYNNQPLAKGGESELYSITTANFTNMVAKVFLPQYRTDYKRDKINYLIQNNPNKAGDNDVVWPTHSLWENGNFIGFLMPRVEGDKLEILCQPAPNSSKQRDKFIQKYPQWQRFLPDQPQAMNLRLKLCYNLLAAVEKLHKTNQYVLVDLKPDNVMVRADGFLSIIDTDSLQICQNGALKYPANVCTPEYTPAEYYTGIDLKKQAVAASWDYFSLAIVVYRLLLGIHPFAASCTGQYQHLTSLDELIKNKLLPILPALKPHFLAIPQPHQRFLLLPEFIQNYLSQSLQAAAQRPALQDFIPQLYQFIMNPAARASLSTAIKKQNPFNMEWWNGLSVEWKEIFEKNTNSNLQDSDFFDKIQALTGIYCGDTYIKNLEPLRNLSNLTELVCVNTTISSLEPLRNLSNLTELYCLGTQISNLEPLRNLSNLTILNCENTQVSSFEIQAFKEKNPKCKVIFSAPKINLEWWNALSFEWWEIFKENTKSNQRDSDFFDKIQALTELNCGLNLYISNLEPLRHLSNLTVLYCHKRQISSLEPLRNLSNLTELYCSETQISNLEPLRNLSNLAILSCSETQISNLEPLRNLSNLAKLDCSETQISSLEPLRDLSNLTKLWCNNTQISSLEPLRNFSNLTKLDCSRTQISSLEPLRNLSNLTILNCRTTQISNLEPLRNFSNLTALSCSETQISNLEPLRNLSNLTNLVCSETLISSLEPLRNLSNLTYLNCENYQISSLEPLHNLLNLTNLVCSYNYQISI